MKNTYNIRTPHAAILIWNYVDRLGNENPKDIDTTEQVIVSTISCQSIQTTKSKSNPQGSFQLILAPTKNWVAAITPGSWCAILMSNDPITQDSINRADPNSLKMIGRIESVRAQTNVNSEGARSTQYFVAGVDWGYIFNNTLYIDNYIQGPNDGQLQGSVFAVAITNILFGQDNNVHRGEVDSNLRSILNVFGSTADGLTKYGNEINRLAKSIYDFRMPQAMVDYLNLINPRDKVKGSLKITENLHLATGSLIANNEYQPTNEAIGMLNPFSLQGQNSLWQVLLENGNPAMNEMVCEFDWRDKDLAMTLYNRIKPFAYKGFRADSNTFGLKSYFQLLKQYEIIDPELVISVNAGTNWRDKYNFIEIKPDFADFGIIHGLVLQKAQTSDPEAFNREGFRPLILGTKQLPTGSFDSKGSTPGSDFYRNFFDAWLPLMREWYFDTHKMLNGTLVMAGISDYIPIGSNIKFDAGLINPTPNINKATYDSQTNQYILAHVETISHSFTVNAEGAREYITTIQFVRGIIVTDSNILYGEGTLDKYADGANGVPSAGDNNDINVIKSDKKVSGDNGNE